MRSIARQALERYPIAVARLTPLSGGFNATYRIDDDAGRRYAMRVQRPDGPTPDMIRAEMTWLKALRRDTSLGVPEPIATRDGDLVAVTGGRSCVLYGWVDGRFLNKRLTPRHLHAVGVFTARLQQHGGTMGEITRRRVTGFDGMSVQEAASLVGTLHSPAGERKLLSVVARAEEAAAELPSGLLHADLHYENVLFHGDEVRAIDFDDCGYGPLLYDLAVTVFELGDRPDLCAALLEGYRSVLPFEHEELIPLFILLRRFQLGVYVAAHRTEPKFRSWWADQLDLAVAKA